jgi:uncharacterized protein YlzI (FlbEa/FlbD family)
MDWVKQSILDGYVIDRIEPFEETTYWNINGKKCPIKNMGYKLILKKKQGDVRSRVRPRRRNQKHV